MASRPKILLVEDEPIIASLYESILVQKYDVITAGNKQLAILQLEAVHPHVLLLDLMIPLGVGEDFITYDHPVGFDILEWLHQHDELSDVRTIIITNLESDEHRKHAEQLGAVRYLVKASVEPHEILRNVDSVLRRS